MTEHPPDPTAVPVTEGGVEPTAEQVQPAPERASAGFVADLMVAGQIVAALGVIGIVLGVVWSAWSPPGPRALVTDGGLELAESESYVAGDGRYLVLSVAVGLVAGLLAWTRRGSRGPLVLLALVVGSLGGSALMWWLGYLTGGGTYSGRVGTIIDRLPLSLHLHGLLFLEAGIAVLVYGVLVAFAVRDDLGRDDPVRDRLLPPEATEADAVSVGPGDHAQDGGGHRDAAGPLQQRDLPPQ